MSGSGTGLVTAGFTPWLHEQAGLELGRGGYGGQHVGQSGALVFQAPGENGLAFQHTAHVVPGFPVGQGLYPDISGNRPGGGQPTADPVWSGVIGSGGQHLVAAEAGLHLLQVAGAQLNVGVRVQQASAAGIANLEFPGGCRSGGGHQLHEPQRAGP